ncbi:MAG: hypothetical protein E7619_03680 [Ruminococcaceae bacterium]|nr:hypothetical protein [Oscillospiraceae bacterium]
MNRAINEKHNLKSEKRRYAFLAFWSLVFFFLLLLRDSYGVGINKYVFVLLTGVCALTMSIGDLICLFCFLFPLYVGMPGNYMTIVLLARLVLSLNKFKFKASSFFCAIFICAFMLCQNLITGYTGIVPMMFIPGIIVVLMLFSYQGELDTKAMTVLYSAGVAALGFIMLKSTLNVYQFSDLLSVGFRLGSGNVDYVEEGIMNVSVDPNFYGAFSMAAVAIGVPLMLDQKTKFLTKTALAVFLATSLVVCLIGLSRAFVLVFVAWVALYLLSQNNIKGTLSVIALSIITVIVVTFTLPDVLALISDRFRSSDLSSGNGRIDLIVKFFGEWDDNLITMLFGVGLFNCNVHCAPLQFFFGGGIVLFLLVAAFALSCGKGSFKSYCFSDLLPILVVFVILSTVPAAGLINFMFPIVFVGLITAHKNQDQACTC